MGLGGGGLQTVDDAAVGIDAHMGLHAKVPVVALPVRGHLGVTGLRPVLRRRRCVDDRRIDQRAGAKRNALACKIGIYLGENGQRRVSFLARSGVLNIVRIRFHRRGHLPGKTVQHIRHLMHPTPLMSCAWKRLVQRVPEPHGTICDCNFRCAGQAATFDVGQELMPVLCAFPQADLKANQLFPALHCRANDHRHRSSVFCHPSLKTDAIRPDADRMQIE